MAQILDHIRDTISDVQWRNAVQLLQRNLTESGDWIVLNVTMDILVRWARDDAALVDWLLPQLERLRSDPRRSVASRASKRLADLTT